MIWSVTLGKHLWVLKEIFVESCGKSSHLPWCICELTLAAPKLSGILCGSLKRQTKQTEQRWQCVGPKKKAHPQVQAHTSGLTVSSQGLMCWDKEKTDLLLSRGSLGSKDRLWANKLLSLRHSGYTLTSKIAFTCRLERILSVCLVACLPCLLMVCLYEN